MCMYIHIYLYIGEKADLKYDARVMLRKQVPTNDVCERGPSAKERRKLIYIYIYIYRERKILYKLYVLLACVLYDDLLYLLA